MARSFDGTNDNLTSADNAVSGINATLKTFSAWMYKTAQPAAAECWWVVCTAITQPDTAKMGCAVPAAAGYKLRFNVQLNIAAGIWTSPDISLNARHHVAVTYDRGATTNDPVMYVDGASVTVTETQAPLGTFETGDDTQRFGENSSAGQDYAGLLQHCVLVPNLLANAAQINRLMWWGRYGGAAVVYPFVTDKLADEGSATDTLTASGATMGNMVTPCVRPGSAMMGMEVGW